MKSFRTVVGGEVMFEISPTSPCPCRSEKPAIQCCLTRSGFRKAPASTTPPQPPTGHSLKRCYATKLNDCSGTLSREHYISESLLHYLNRYEDLRVEGLPWLNGEQRVMRPEALAAKILCERHNRALSSLDAMAVNLFQAFDEEGVVGSGQQLIHLFCGHDIERWLLKILCGTVFSNNLTPDDTGNVSLDKTSLEILFGYTDVADQQGLYICTERGHTFKGPRGLGVSAIVRAGELSGMGLWICGFEFVLSLVGFPTRRFDGRTFAYRPLEFYTQGRGFEKSVLLSWRGTADLGTLSLEIQTSSPPPLGQNR